MGEGSVSAPASASASAGAPKPSPPPSPFVGGLGVHGVRGVAHMPNDTLDEDDEVERVRESAVLGCGTVPEATAPACRRRRCCCCCCCCSSSSSCGDASAAGGAPESKPSMMTEIIPKPVSRKK